VECRDPAGPEFDALDVNLLSRVTIEDIAGFNGTPGDPHTGNEMWGYTSPLGRRYALVGTTTGTGIVEVTDPRNPVIVAFIAGGVDVIWRDMAVYRQYLYIVTDGDGVGMQIVDLSDIDNGNATLLGATDLGMGFVDAHNVYVNPDSGFLYLAIPNLNGGNGLTAISLSDPVNPQFAGFWTDTVGDVQCHDVQVISYADGPNAGKEIAFCFAEDDGVKIADVTTKNAMFTISTLTYPTLGYCHQGWLSDDRRYVYFNDELDEYWGIVSNTRTYVADVQDLSSPGPVQWFDHSGCWIDHNLMVRGDRVYQAHYAAGLRVLDAADPLSLSEVAYFDTRPEDNVQDFPGAWGVFTDYPTRIVTVSDRQRGLFVLCDEPGKPIPGFVLDQNPATQNAPVGFDAASSTTCDPSRWVVSYEWDFDYDGVTFDIEAAGSTPTHTYTAVRDYTVALRVTDNQGARAISSLTITVQEGIPTISEWGLVVTTLLLLTTGTVTIRAKRSVGQDLVR
jgi:choice-of-anchor B domain-containing protein